MLYMGNCVGLTLVLKKRMKCVCVDDTKQRQFTLFGHYDALDIHNIDTWYQFRPRGMAGIKDKSLLMTCIVISIALNYIFHLPGKSRT